MIMTEVQIKDGAGHVYKCYDIDGYRVPLFFLPPTETRDIVRAIPDVYCRSDDVMLCAYPKTGTNWMFEILHMMLRASSERIKLNKSQTMLEAVPPGMIEDSPSPRILNTHLNPRFLPKDVATKKIKTVLVVRNPKDTAVSFYNHMTGFGVYNYDGKWKDWFPLYINGKMEYGKYTTYLREWEDIIRKEAKFPLHVVYYEDLHRTPLKELKRLAKFLDTNLSDTILNDIIKSCSFAEMAKNKLHPNIKKVLFKENFQFFRKGKIGDWRAWFTEEQNKEHDALWEQEMAGSSFKFIYDDLNMKSKL